MFLSDPSDALQFCLAESIVVRHSHRPKPELGEFPIPLDVNVRRLVSVAGEEEKPVRAALQGSWTQRTGFCQFIDLAAKSKVRDPALG
jgi:hypothetical protein